jgi:dihydrodiol dehydrogenase / D-xylose 1-dehydrogenase (NADP)
MSSHDECRWALLGLSGISELFVPDLLLPRPESSTLHHRITAVSTTGSVDRARQWLAQRNVPEPSSVQVYSSYERMLETGGFDIVYISTPHSLHFLHARAAIVHGHNVLVEKPATMNRLQYERLCELAQQHRVVFMEAFWTRYLPLTQHIQEQFLPRLGRIKRIFADISLPLLGDPRLGPMSRSVDKKTGAGSLLDLGVYPLTWCDIALSQHTSPSAQETPVTVRYAEKLDCPTEIGEPIDDITTVILSGGNPPITCIVTASQSVPGSPFPPLQERFLRPKNTPCLRIQGTEAEIALQFPPMRPESLTIQYYGKDRVDENGLETEDTITKEVHGWGLWYQADVIAQAVRDRGLEPAEGLVIGYDGSLRVLGWVDQAKALAGIKYDEQLERSW